jgi:Cu2+-exporting ATPase
MSAVAACPGCLAAPAEAAVVAAGAADLVLSIPEMQCGACIAGVERCLTALPGVQTARVHLGRKQVRIAGTIDGAAAIAALAAAGYTARELDADLLEVADPQGRRLLVRLAVSGFAMMNVMLLSVAIWSGATDATRAMFHWVSAAIALPAVVFAAQPFFSSAVSALAARRLNMDVPITLAIALASAMSLYETAAGGQHAWFDAALSLTFFLLAGRYLDHLTRRAARSAAAELTALESRRVTRLEAGLPVRVRPEALARGDVVEALAGDRLAVDGRVLEGRARLDRSLLTGESAPVPVAPGGLVQAGEVVLDGRLTVEVAAAGEDSSLRRLAALVGRAESVRNRYTALADRAAAVYAPVVHLLALAALLGWWLGTGDARLALNVAVAVLIITCPCALGLAVPAVSTAAAGRLFRAGFLLRHDTALERLGEVDTVVFDKTGTLTLGGHVGGLDALGAEERAALAALARASAHPAARAVAAALPPLDEGVTEVRETAGQGVRGLWRGQRALMGRAEWLGGAGNGLTFRLGEGSLNGLQLEETLRPGARAAVEGFRRMGLEVHLLSGDREAAVASVASRLGIDRAAAAVGPEEKIAYLEALRAKGARVLMVGDGLNDTAALAAAHASLAPASALDASRAAADVVLLREDLSLLPEAVATSRRAGRRMRENFGIAAGYNMVAIPLALAGFATPLMAALAMSTSSITVVLNAMRVRVR